MPTPLLAFLNDIEEALRKESGLPADAAWNVSRIVNYHHGLARMTLTPPPYVATQKRGAIFLQSVALADGRLCFKASLTWHGSDAFPTMEIISEPRVSWKNEAERIAAAWLIGPSSSGTPFGSTQSASPLSAALD
jgi:hypothetical protein